MQRYTRKENRPVPMYFCKDPITIDKSGSWGKGNVQNHPDGAWVQTKNGKVSHLVANEVDHPVGWRSIDGNLFVKNDIFASQETENTSVELDTLDGKMTYENPNLNGYVCYNIKDGSPDPDDPWFVTKEDFEGLYVQSVN